MKNEISAVVYFLSRLVKKNEKLRKEEIERFSDELARILHDKYVNHWYPETPSRGQAYRCIRVNMFQGADPALLKACLRSGLMYDDLGLPREITLWVDPWEVCCRYGEKNHAFTVACFESEEGDQGTVSEKVTHAMERVTSDYHSGSSSDDEIHGNVRKTLSASAVTSTQSVYKEPEFVLQSVPFWNKYPKRKPGPHYHHRPRFLSSYHPQGSVKVPGQTAWLLPVVSSERNHWTNVHVLAAGHRGMVQ
ncbi:protein BTG3 [Spea bombifrons]|uniref:protein BTG3 n=1 Tax=Spea bombifrons TaxID=233779 RepID=UPI0023492094|nr:protein BTG3 [Spea bombifrons]